jgi:hypothetical protein
VPARTFWDSVNFCFANSFASSSLRNVSVARAKFRFPDRNFVSSNETYQLSWGLIAIGEILAGKKSSIIFPTAARNPLCHNSAAPPSKSKPGRWLGFGIRQRNPGLDRVRRKRIFSGWRTNPRNARAIQISWPSPSSAQERAVRLIG